MAWDSRCAEKAILAQEGYFGQADIGTPSPSFDAMREWPNHVGNCENTELCIIGHIPSYAAGTLYRTGPSSSRVDTPRGAYSYNHWFDGFSKTNRFQIIPSSAGVVRVLYSSRSQVDGLIEKIRETGDFQLYTFARKRDPCVGLLGKLFSFFIPFIPERPDIANVPATIRFTLTRDPEKKQTTLTLGSDISVVKALDPETLAPIGIAHQKALHPLLKGPMSSSHPMYDPETGDIFNYNLDFGILAGMHTVYRVFRVNASGTTDILATITGPNTFPAYIHSFFLTRDFVILCIRNSYIAAGGLTILWNKNFLDVISPFDPTQKARWYVVDRRHRRGLVAEYQSPAMFCFHTVNAWQQSNLSGTEDIVCDLLEYPNLDVLHKFYYSNLMPSRPDAAKFFHERWKYSRPRLARYILRNVPEPTLTKKCHSSSSLQAELVKFIPGSQVGEVPTINQAYATKESRYVYTIVDRGLSTFFDGISKADMATQEVAYWDNPKGHTPGEPIFVADPHGTAEDDGVLLSVVLDGFKETSYLLCLDAKTMKELGRAECDFLIGLDTHGQHVNMEGMM